MEKHDYAMLGMIVALAALTLFNHATSQAAFEQAHYGHSVQSFHYIFEPGQTTYVRGIHNETCLRQSLPDQIDFEIESDYDMEPEAEVRYHDMVPEAEIQYLMTIPEDDGDASEVFGRIAVHKWKLDRCRLQK